jgi:hypothetical protein
MEEDLDKIAEKYYKYKLELAEIEKKVQKYRGKIERILNDSGSDDIQTKIFSISRVGCSKRTVSQKDLPKEIWDKYSKSSKYYMYYVKEKKYV